MAGRRGKTSTRAPGSVLAPVAAALLLLPLLGACGGSPGAAGDVTTSVSVSGEATEVSGSEPAGSEGDAAPPSEQTLAAAFARSATGHATKFTVQFGGPPCTGVTNFQDTEVCRCPQERSDAFTEMAWFTKAGSTHWWSWSTPEWQPYVDETFITSGEDRVELYSPIQVVAQWLPFAEDVGPGEALLHALAKDRFESGMFASPEEALAWEAETAPGGVIDGLPGTTARWHLRYSVDGAGRLSNMQIVNTVDSVGKDSLEFTWGFEFTPTTDPIKVSKPAVDSGL